MKFQDNKAIYLQIANYVCEQIIRKEIAEGDKVLSIRELAIKLEVNPNTVQRAYDLLEGEQIIQNKRGIGFFLDEKSYSKTLEWMQNQFFESDLKDFFRSVKLLNLDWEDLHQKYLTYQAQNS
jgi:GntR family transcriptional regulator